VARPLPARGDPRRRRLPRRARSAHAARAGGERRGAGGPGRIPALARGELRDRRRAGGRRRLDRVVIAARLVLGTAQWGGPYGIANREGPPPAPERARLLARAQAAGVRALDTARAYGASEARLGAALAGGAARFAIGTKLAPDACPPGASAAEVCARTERGVAESGAALGVARLDALLLHRAAHRRAAGGAAWARLCAERRAGAIGRLGVSATSPAEAWDAL